MQIKESGEMYLEVMYNLFTDHGEIRSVDVAKALGYSKPSVSRAIGLLKKEGFIEQEPYGKITLTEKGFARAKMVADRHELLTEFLVKALGVSADTAEQDACRIEHIVSQETMAAVRAYLIKNK
ncbi:MAG: metal-dependent transcriptional regulator [Eubacteriales bacterium]